MSIFILIEIVGAILYLSQKVLLSFNKRYGWLLGFLGAIAFTVVTLHKGSYAYMVLEITSGVIFLFGLFVWKGNGLFQKRLTILMSILAVVGITVIFLLNVGSPNLIIENVMVLLFTLGAVLLVLRNCLGWILYILGSLVLMYYGYLIQTYFIALLQVTYLPFAIIGYKNFKQSQYVPEGKAETLMYKHDIM
jgi:nicotinamide riboside transporter PnuC